MTRERHRLTTAEERLVIYARDNGICQHCGQPVDINAFEVAHRIANVIWAVKKYGRLTIDHPLNKATTHPGACNSGVLVTFNPVEREALVEKIKRAGGAGE